MTSNSSNTIQSNSALKIGLKTAVEDYRKLIDEKVECDIDENESRKNFKQISEAMRNVIWKLIFDDVTNVMNHKIAAEALAAYRLDACFHNPYDYNRWIPLVRDELLKREMLSFWNDIICKEELGLCCAKDCDYFDDPDDPEPIEFYAVGKKLIEKPVPAPAPAVEETKKLDDSIDVQKYLDIYAPCTGHHHNPQLSSGDHKDVPFIIGMEDPVADYKRLIELKVESAADDDEMMNNFNKISEQIRDTIWKLLFINESLMVTDSNLKKAENALETYKADACFHNPYAYNDWIPKVRDELLRRKMFVFWKEVIVEKKLGLCWARDSDLFDDLDDPKPAEFYNVTCSDVAIDN